MSVPVPDHESMPGDAPVLAPQLEPVPARNTAADPPWTIWNVLSLAVIAMFSVLFFTTVAVMIAKSSMHMPFAMLARNPVVVLPAMIAAYAVLVGSMVATVKTTGQPFWTTIEWNFPGRNAVGYATFGLALAILVGLASKLLPIPKSLPIDNYFTNATGAYMMAIFGITFAPLVEELFFRGFLYPVIARRFGVGVSIVVTALCFAFIHEAQLAHAWAPLLLLWVVGVALTAVRAWTKSVGASFCVHAGYNLTLFTLMYIATDHFRHLEKLT